MSKIFSMQILQADLLTAELLRLTLQAPAEFQHQAGDYLFLGLQEDDLKPFSIATTPTSDNTLEIHIRNLEKTQWMEDLFQVKTGDKVVIKGPEKQMRLQAENQQNIFVAGGTGIAPMKALLEKRLEEGLTQNYSLYWGARNFEELYINAELSSLADKNSKLNYIPVLSEEAWQGRIGLVHKAVLEDFSNLANATVYICGHWDMIQIAKEDFIQAGLNPDNFIH